MAFAALCAGGSAFIYEADVNLGHGPMSPRYLSGAASIAACVWVFYVFPRMGNGWATDVLSIAAAYPCVGGMTGFLIAFWQPIGIPFGASVAINLPWLFPVIVLPIYLSGAAVIFLLPRIWQST